MGNKVLISYSFDFFTILLSDCLKPVKRVTSFKRLSPSLNETLQLLPLNLTSIPIKPSQGPLINFILLTEWRF